MRSDDEDDEEEYEEEHDEDEDDGMNGQANHLHELENENEEDDDAESDAEGEVEADGEVDMDGDAASADHSEEEGSEGEGEGGEDEEDEDEDEEEEGDDDDDDEEEDEDEGDGEEEEGEGEGEGDGEEDVDMAEGDEASSHTSHRSQPKPLPPHLVRRQLFTPSFTTPPKTLSIEAIVGIPLPTAVHSLALTADSSYLLTGAQDGYVRAYNLWSSVNGSQAMTAQQRGMVGLGEGVSKAGVARGWWSNEVNVDVSGEMGRRREPVYSLACEGDGLWALSGTKSGQINLYTLRHSPGHHIHSLKGHSNVVSCMALLPSEKSFLSGSWDGSVREWDLNTGQTVRSFPTHGAQLSSLSLRPYTSSESSSPASPNGPRHRNGNGETDDEANGVGHISVSVGPDFFDKRENGVKENGHADGDIPNDIAKAADDNGDATPTGPVDSAPAATTPPPASGPAADDHGDMDVDAADNPSPYDPLFDDPDADAEGESIIPSGDNTSVPSPAPVRPPSPPATSRPLSLALPAPSSNPDPPAPSTQPVVPPSSTPVPSSTPLFATPAIASSSRAIVAAAARNIPLLTPRTWRSYSDDVFLTSSMDGQVVLIDRRVPSCEGSNAGVGRLQPSDKTPPWCMSACWSGNGNQVLAGRRNGTIDIWDVRRSSSSSAPNLLRTLRTPAESGPVSCLVGFPDGRHVASASQDNIRLWNTHDYFHPEETSMKKSRSRPPFKIIAGHHGGTLSSMLVDPTGRFLITASGDRGWQGESTKVVLIHEVKY